MPERSPLAPASFPSLSDIEGVRLAVGHAGYHYADTRMDLLLAEFVPGTVAVGVTTQSACASPEVEWCRERLPSHNARGLVVSSGNSNAFTGKRGKAAAEMIGAEAARLLGCDLEKILLSATGVIGVPLPAARALNVMETVTAQLGTASFEDAARAISTTDTFPKGAGAAAIIGGARVSIAGIAKGSGMIAPDMATMLGYIFTDARVAPALLHDMLVRANARSFNSITVDGDTSTSDTVLLFATGQTGPLLEKMTDPGAHAFYGALCEICEDLAQQIVRDGEGASKFITIRVSGAVSDSSARKIGMSIANSPLVKTAIAGSDANWGRVVMAVGKAGEPADRDRLSIRFGSVTVAQQGEVVAGYDEAPVAKHLQGDEIDIGVSLGLGDGAARIWTCDLTHGYIIINADYRS
ncbi:bifunctional glutamate N-acetyltransferase/amino-acid acetyltransferase ArgJ [Pacificimonas sp. WHA3]|uniref:Arginine biosynthesis bifunctional protein ArgJ n=1 Tax=Pacificimonas pallii TaxID=2827236 RepID=A0ABS6SBL8_9SPHN|nr:bifunctional glutamate N-acetyltransferase/amino-acid acetyltransferase ArgJ [Pacificimonas pallii]MBV7255483.1 bifunctional glutamate N-acetyltransferase/amino-acid acetyltransferase ArgJ [Pacificimonas pallii]